MNGRVAVGIDLGGTNLKVAIVNEQGTLLAKHSQATESASGPAHVVSHMASAADALLKELGIHAGSVAGVGIGTPGPLDLKHGRITKAANLEGWQNVPLRDLLADRMRLPIVLENDGNAAAFGEWWAGAAEEHGDLVMLTLGTGVGAGVILDGKVLHGHFDNAAELGHTIVVADGIPCPCGQRGCLEQYASASGVVRRVEAAIQSGEPSSLAKQSPINAENVVDAARCNDALCQRTFDDACRYLGIACVNIQHTYNPALIVLGGGLASAGDFLIDRVRRHYVAERWQLHDDCAEIRLAALGSDAGVIGAAGLALRP